jgi:hypothetical protein
MYDRLVRRKGLEVVPDAPKDPVVETRKLKMPDGTVLVCRRRETKGRWSKWTAEVPLELAKRFYAVQTKTDA